MDHKVDALWQIELLGWLRLVGQDREITRFRTRKVGSLLAFLAYHSHRSHPREVLTEILWPQAGPHAGSVSLRTALASLRRQLEPPGVPAGTVLLTSRDSVRLNPQVCETDVARFERALRHAARADDPGPGLLEAIELYRGELLPGYFDAWILSERQRLLETYLAALEELVRQCEERRDLHGAIQWARRAVGADPLREEAHECLIRLLAAAGQPETALRQYQELERLLCRELSAAPEAALRALARELEARIAAHHRVDRPSAGRGSLPGSEPVRDPFPPGRTPASVATLTSFPGRAAALQLSLPPRLTRFFGRESEIERLRETFGHRLVTLTGPGGTGKTRLVEEAAARLRERFAGAVAYVPLVALNNPELIAGQILDVLRVARSAELPPLEQAASFLTASRKPALLVLDNFEHLLPEGAAVVSSLLERVDHLSLWITSRQSLGLPGEQELPVRPLPVPSEGVGGGVSAGTRAAGDGSVQGSSAESYTLHPTPYTLSRCPSVALFVDRAQSVRPDFQLTPSNAAAVARLCTALEGLPLAIELAAARIGVLTPAQMLSRLEERFDLLTTSRRLPDRRHQSLRATVDWSYQLLSPELQRFFARLSVFRGGWTLAAAEAVCGEDGVRSEEAAPAPNAEHRKPALDSLQQLQESSLVLAEERHGGMRYRLLETLREFGRERLQEAGEAEVVSQRHARFFLELVEQAEPELHGPEQAAWIGRLDEEYDNVRAALACGQSREDESETGLRLVGALFWFWWIRCHHSEGAGWGQRVLAGTGGAPGVPAHEEPRTAPARTRARAKACRCTGGMLWAQGRCQEARPLMEEGVAIAREVGDSAFLALTLRFLGWAALDSGDQPAGRSAVEESLALFRTIGDQIQIGRSLNFLASLARLQGDYETAAARWQETVTASRQAGDPWAVSVALAGLAKLAEWRGDRETARSKFAQSLELRWANKDVRGVADCLEGIAGLTSEDPAAERAAQLFGAAAAANEVVGAPLPVGHWPVDRAPVIALLRDRLGPAKFAAAWARGHAMELKEAVAEALEEPAE